MTIERCENINLILKANVYYDGNVISHTIEEQDGSKKSVGMIYAGTYAFNTEAPERMDIISGNCKVKLAGQKEWIEVVSGSYFEVPGNSSFEISIESGHAEYLCTYY